VTTMRRFSCRRGAPAARSLSSAATSIELSSRLGTEMTLSCPNAQPGGRVQAGVVALLRSQNHRIARHAAVHGAGERLLQADLQPIQQRARAAET